MIYGQPTTSLRPLSSHVEDDHEDHEHDYDLDLLTLMGLDLVILYLQLGQRFHIFSGAVLEMSNMYGD